MLMLALVAGFMLLSAPVSAGDGTCASIKDFETKVNVNLVLADPYIDLSKTKKQINRYSEIICKSSGKQMICLLAVTRQVLLLIR